METEALKSLVKEPASTGTTTFDVETRYVGDEIKLKELQEKLAKLVLNKGGNPLVLQLSEKEPVSYAVLTKFGTVSFWVSSTRESGHMLDSIGMKEKFLELISPFIQNKKENYDFMDTLEVVFGDPNLNAKKPRDVTFDAIRLYEPFHKNGAPNLEFMKIISYVPAQSGKTDNFEVQIDKVIDDVTPKNEELASTGSISTSQEEIMKQMGAIMLVKQSVVGTIALLDKPEETWDYKGLEELYDDLSAEYDLRNRFETLNKKMDFLMDVNRIFDGVVAAKRNEEIAKRHEEGEKRNEQAAVRSHKIESQIRLFIVIEIFLALPYFVTSIAPYILKLFHR